MTSQITCPKFGSLESYVDDSKQYLLFSVKDAWSVVQEINDDLSKIVSCLINSDKTKLMVVGTRQMLQRLPTDFYVTLLGKKVTIASSVRDLGLQVDSTLSFDEHITNAVSSCLGSLRQINRVRHLLDTRTLENIINALVILQFP